MWSNTCTPKSVHVTFIFVTALIFFYRGILVEYYTHQFSFIRHHIDVHHDVDVSY